MLGNSKYELRKYLLKENNLDAPTIIICPGGSYFHLAKKSEGVEVAKWLNNNGCNAFVLYYRVDYYKFQHPEMLKDLQKAIYDIRFKSDIYKINANKIGVMGFSAGGHLVGLSAVYSEHSLIENKNNISLKPNFVAMIYPVVTMQGEFVHQKSKNSLLGKNPTKQTESNLSLEMHVKDDLPPFFIVHSKDDKTVNYHNSVILAEALKSKQIDYQLFLYETGGHGYGVNSKKAKGADSWKNEFLTWIKDINQ